MNGLSIVIVAIQVEMNAPKIEGQYPRAQAGITWCSIKVITRCNKFSDKRKSNTYDSIMKWLKQHPPVCREVFPIENWRHQLYSSSTSNWFLSFLDTDRLLRFISSYHNPFNQNPAIYIPSPSRKGIEPTPAYKNSKTYPCPPSPTPGREWQVKRARHHHSIPKFIFSVFRSPAWS